MLAMLKLVMSKRNPFGYSPEVGAFLRTFCIIYSNLHHNVHHTTKCSRPQNIIDRPPRAEEFQAGGESREIARNKNMLEAHGRSLVQLMDHRLTSS